jgi:tRNA A-37 threonylcarbamoyl transferase component Bud32
MKEYIGGGWDRILRLNKLDSFDAIWSLEAGWFEEPNERRGGWSGVSKISLKTENGGSVGVFLKRQENHNTKVWYKPFKGIPTFYRELKNILRFIAHGIPTVEPVYFNFRYEADNCQAILMTKELEGFESLDAPVFARDGVLMQDKVKREQIMRVVANAMRKMHDHHFCHNCFYSKHIFVRSVEGQWEVKFIDLEKLSKNVFKKNAMMRDLYTLPRRIIGWGRKDRLKFFQLYRQEDKLSSASKLIWQKIDHRIKRKGIVL